MDDKVKANPSLAYRGYERELSAEPDKYLTQVGRGTPGGEYLRRFWQPVAFESELKDTPFRIRVMGEDLVAFRDRSGQIGVLHLHCAHRRTSLEYGIILERGIRCCYHGWIYDVDGTIVDIPGDPVAAERMRSRVSQGAYPVHLMGGLVFIYMGPPEKRPPFPNFERFNVPGIKLEPGGPRLPFPCNWIQIKENAMDPAHTAVLHAIPQMRGMDHFAGEFGEFPEFVFSETSVGMMYLAARKLDDKVWVRSTDYVAPNIHSISSIFESGRKLKSFNPPFRTIWTTPVDDDFSINFTISHVADDDQTLPSKRRYLEIFGQTDERPYRERQIIPGDYDAMVSEGPVEIHALEHLGSHDTGVSMFRRLLRKNIEQVERGEDPAPFPESIPTYCSDRVVDASSVGGSPDDPAVLKEYARRLGEEYLVNRSLSTLRIGE